MFRLKGVTSTSRASLDRMALSVGLKLGSLQLGDVLRHASVLHKPKPIGTYLISMYENQSSFASVVFQITDQEHESLAETEQFNL